ncbi:hypothetical protein BH012_13065 [Salmonella enterica]|nr:hypothetical protein [Salmonella enterica]EAX6602247.1 hypothetical protein [Salmonella enterica]
MKYKFLSLSMTIVGVLFLSGCANKSSSIDAQKSQNNKVVQVSNPQLTDQDVFGNELTLNNITEEDIQNAVEDAKGEFTIPLHSAVILVQSGSKAPDALMQQEMKKFYQVSTFSGIPVTKRKVRNKNDDDSVSDDVNYMQALRYIAAKGRQKAIIVFWSALEVGKFNNETKAVQWEAWNSKNIPSGDYSLRYLTRVALTDVATGEWSVYSPSNVEMHNVHKEAVSSDSSSKIIEELKRNTYEWISKDLANRYSPGRLKIIYR